MFITNNHASFHLWGKENLVKHQKVSIYYEQDCSFKLIDFFSINKQITIITIVVQNREKFCLCFTKINTKSFSGSPKLPLIPKVSPSLNIKKLFLRLSV